MRRMRCCGLVMCGEPRTADSANGRPTFRDNVHQALRSRIYEELKRNTRWVLYVFFFSRAKNVVLEYRVGVKIVK